MGKSNGANCLQTAATGSSNVRFGFGSGVNANIYSFIQTWLHRRTPQATAAVAFRLVVPFVLKIRLIFAIDSIGNDFHLSDNQKYREGYFAGGFDPKPEFFCSPRIVNHR